MSGKGNSMSEDIEAGKSGVVCTRNSEPFTLNRGWASHTDNTHSGGKYIQKEPIVVNRGYPQGSILFKAPATVPSNHAAHLRLRRKCKPFFTQTLSDSCSLPTLCILPKARSYLALLPP